MREGAQMGHGDDLAPGDAAVAHEAGYDHIQCNHQCMREGPAVAHSGKLAAEDEAVEHGG